MFNYSTKIVNLHIENLAYPYLRKLNVLKLMMNAQYVYLPEKCKIDRQPKNIVSFPPHV